MVRSWTKLTMLLAGCAVVAGTASAQSQFATLWTATNAGVAASFDAVKGVRVDSSGNVYVLRTTGGTTTSYSVLEYSSLGVLNRTINPSGSTAYFVNPVLTLDSSGNPVVVSQTAIDSTASTVSLKIFRWNAAGTILTNATIAPSTVNASYSTLKANAAVVTSSNALVIAGEASNGTAAGTDALFVKTTFNASGTGVTSSYSTYNGTGGNYDSAEAVALTSAGDPIFVGTATATGGVATGLTAKYATSGWSRTWLNEQTVSGASALNLKSVAVDQTTGGFAAAGQGQYSTTGLDGVVLSASSTGAVSWAKNYDAGQNGIDGFTKVALNSAGIHVAGAGHPTAGFNAGIAYQLYDTNGNVVRTVQLSGAATGDDAANDLVVDAAGTALIAGAQYQGLATGKGFVVERIDSDGTTSQYLFDGVGDDTADAITLNSSGDAIAAGYLNGTSSVFAVALDMNPVGLADTYSTSEGTELDISAPGVLSNDLRILGATPSLVTANSVTAGTTAGGGTVTLNSDGSFKYVPAALFHGSDSFYYQLQRGTLTTSPILVTVNVSFVNHNPVANDDSYSVLENTATTFNVTSNDTDADGDTLTITSVTQPAHGTVTFGATGARYTTNFGYTGADSFTYTIGDGNGGSATATVNVMVMPNDFTVTSVSPTSVTAGSGAYTMTVDGRGFSNTSTVLWNGNPLTTTYVSSTELQATVPALNIALAGSAVVRVSDYGHTTEGQVVAINGLAKVAASVLNSTRNGDGSVSLTVRFSNVGTADSLALTLSAASLSLGGASTTTLPNAIGVIAAGDHSDVTLTFPGTGSAGSLSTLTLRWLGGTTSGATTFTTRVTLP